MTKAVLFFLMASLFFVSAPLSALACGGGGTRIYCGPSPSEGYHGIPQQYRPDRCEEEPKSMYCEKSPMGKAWKKIVDFDHKVDSSREIGINLFAHRDFLPGERDLFACYSFASDYGSLVVKKGRIVGVKTIKEMIAPCLRDSDRGQIEIWNKHLRGEQ